VGGLIASSEPMTRNLRLGVLGEPPWRAPALETRRLRLRAPKHQDAGELFDLFSDARVMEHTDDVPYPDIERALLRVSDWLGRGERGTGLQWVMTLGDRVIGECGLHAVAPKYRKAEMGFALAHEHWRIGYMTEAVHAVLSFGFKELALNKVEARTVGSNAAARALLRSVGFREEGVLRQHAYWKERFHDLHAFGLLASEWSL